VSPQPTNTPPARASNQAPAELHNHSYCPHHHHHHPHPHPPSSIFFPQHRQLTPPRQHFHCRTSREATQHHISQSQVDFHSRIMRGLILAILPLLASSAPASFSTETIHKDAAPIISSSNAVEVPDSYIVSTISSRSRERPLIAARSCSRSTSRKQPLPIITYGYRMPISRVRTYERSCGNAHLRSHPISLTVSSTHTTSQETSWGTRGTLMTPSLSRSEDIQM